MSTSQQPSLTVDTSGKEWVLPAGASEQPADEQSPNEVADTQQAAHTGSPGHSAGLHALSCISAPDMTASMAVDMPVQAAAAAQAAACLVKESHILTKGLADDAAMVDSFQPATAVAPPPMPASSLEQIPAGAVANIHAKVIGAHATIATVANSTTGNVEPDAISLPGLAAAAASVPAISASTVAGTCSALVVAPSIAIVGQQDTAGQPKPADAAVVVDSDDDDEAPCVRYAREHAQRVKEQQALDSAVACALQAHPSKAQAALRSKQSSCSELADVIGEQAKVRSIFLDVENMLLL